jgi:hypothetical protein
MERTVSANNNIILACREERIIHVFHIVLHFICMKEYEPMISRGETADSKTPWDSTGLESAVSPLMISPSG